MQHLTERDAFCLSAAMGWVELGNPLEATMELEQITPSLKNHPDVLCVKWSINAKAKNWETCLDIARAFLKSDDSLPFAWIHQSYSLRRVPNGSVQAAFNALLPAAEMFLDEPTITYNLSCYAAQLGNLDEARKWLTQAFVIARKTGQTKSFKFMAIEDSDLEPFWRLHKKEKFFASLE